MSIEAPEALQKKGITQVKHSVEGEPLQGDVVLKGNLIWLFFEKELTERFIRPVEEGAENASNSNAS